MEASSIANRLLYSSHYLSFYTLIAVLSGVCLVLSLIYSPCLPWWFWVLEWVVNGAMVNTMNFNLEIFIFIYFCSKRPFRLLKFLFDF